MSVTVYSIEFKKAIVRKFLDERALSGCSLRRFAGEHGIAYYTFRNWYRNPEINPGKRKLQIQRKPSTLEYRQSMISEFLKEKTEKGRTISDFARIHGIPFYTFRDWYRDPAVNPEWPLRYEGKRKD